MDYSDVASLYRYSDIQRRVTAALERIDTARAHAQAEQNVALQIAVKTQTAIDCLFATQALADLKQPIIVGHNRVQEAVETTEAIHQVPGAQLHLIGPLQSNKVNHALRSVDAVDTIDRASIVSALDSRLNRTLPVMIQVNVSQEESKSGCNLNDASALVELIQESSHLQLTGFMTVGLNSDDERAVRRAYANLRELRDRMAADLGLATTELHLSMGMSGDLEWAVAEGATIVRLGTAIFGPRN